MVKKNPAAKKGRPGPEVAAKGLKQVKKILRKEPSLSQQYLDIAGVILVCLSPDQSITMINRKGCELLGYAQKYLLGKNWFDVILPENERAEIKAMFARLISGELKPIEYVENHVVTRDGEKRLISWHNTLVRDEEGDITGSLSSGEDITERRQAEEAMRDQEIRLRGIVENSQAGYFSIDLEGRFRQVNDAWLRMHGYKSPDEVIGKHLSLTQVEADYETAQRNVKFLLAGNPIPTGESTRRRKDGSVGYHTFSAHPIFRADKVIGLEGFIIDTTVIKQSQESLLHLTQLNQEVISGAQEGIVVYDLQMCYVLWNAFMETLTGVMASEILGKCALDVFPHLREQGVDRLIERALAGEIIRSPDTPFRSPATGRSGWVVGTYAPHRNINGDIVGVIATIQDITERKKAEETLSELGVYNRSLIEASIDPLVTIDHAGKISDVNIATEQITGLSRHDLIGSDFSDYFTDPGKAREGYRRVFKRSTVRDYSLEIRHRDGHSTEVLYNASVYRDKSGQVRGVFAAARDITDRIRLEEEQQKVAKLESIGILAAGIAHNFNNILTVILGNISLAKMDAIPGSETHQILDQAEKASVKAKDLTAQLLTFSKGGAPVKKIASLTELLKDTADSALQGSNVICHFSIPADLRQAEFDEAQLRQVIYNLVLNAQQAMPKGGTIDLLAENITVGTTQDRSKDIMLEAGDYVRIAVTDHGSGIPEKNISKIFDPFFTTKIKAIGLGLATSFSIVRQHGGYIRVDSRAGAGTTVHVYLPIAKESERNPDN